MHVWLLLIDYINYMIKTIINCRPKIIIAKYNNYNNFFLSVLF